MDSTKKYDEAFCETFEVEAKSLETLEYQSIEAWDSVGHMALMAALEDSFEIELDIDDIIDFSSYPVGKQVLSKYGVRFDD